MTNFRFANNHFEKCLGTEENPVYEMYFEYDDGTRIVPDSDIYLAGSTDLFYDALPELWAK
jgi:hypothetical protein